MENPEESPNSLPYIDDATTDEEINPHQYNLKIIENYHNKNRNIEITNRYPQNDEKSVGPIAPLADETEFSDTPDEDNHMRKIQSKESGMKVVIKGWNSSISIQGLDNKSSITFKRRCEKMHKKVERNMERRQAGAEEGKPVEKSKKGRWKMLTRSIMLAKSARFERRGLDERYPKYVLLKNEEEEVTQVKENYPKMFVFNEKDEKHKKNAEPKPEFSFKKSFKNKTEPIVPLDEILAKTERAQSEQSKTKAKVSSRKQKQPLTERNLTVKKKIVVERRKSLTIEKPIQSESQVGGSHGQVCNEIQGIFEDALKLYPQTQSEAQQQAPKRGEYYSSVPPSFCQFPCHDPYCCPNQPPKYVPVYGPHKSHVYGSNAQTKCQDQEMPAEAHPDRDIDLESLPFGILSSFFPRVVIMNAIHNEGLRDEEENIGIANETGFENFQPPKAEEAKIEVRAIGSLEVPQSDLTLKSKMVSLKPEVEEIGDVSLKEFPGIEKDQKTKSQESVATEYLHYSECDPGENESIEPTNPTPTPPPSQNDSNREKEDKRLPPFDKFKTEDVDGNSENLSLTKIGYKMYDNLTKLSLNREKEITEKTEVSGCGCNGNETKKSPYNITLESNNSVVKVTVPENELNFQIVNSEGGDIQIGVMKGEEKKLVRKEELWHVDDGRRALILKNEARPDQESKGFQKFKVSLADSKEIVLSIEMNETDKNQKKIKEISTKEMKVGTDDFDLAGGDFVCALEGNCRNLSPRIGQLLKHLHEKLETDEKERKFLDEKINQKLIDQKYQGGLLPGVFLVKHISPRIPAPPKISEVKKSKKSESQGQLREYYCEECLATMRIFEDENPSVKSMVDKFETIIQLESY